MALFLLFIFAGALANSCDKQCLTSCDPSQENCFNACNCEFKEFMLDSAEDESYSIRTLQANFEWDFSVGTCDLACSNMCFQFSRGLPIIACLDYCGCNEFVMRINYEGVADQLDAWKIEQQRLAEEAAALAEAERIAAETAAAQAEAERIVAEEEQSRLEEEAAAQA